MAGPGLRSVAIAETLAAHVDVTFASGVSGSSAVDFSSPRVRQVTYATREELERLVDRVDVVFCQLIDTNVVRHALARRVRVIYDLYNALPVETVGADRISGFTDEEGKEREFNELLGYFRFVVRTGSFFVASNERQRDFWLGYLMASGAMTPSTLRGRSLEDIIGLVPFGMSETDPHAERHALRGAHGITDDDLVLIWAGGIWDWFDAVTPIEAVARLSKTRPDVKLVFYGTVHPNPTIGRPAGVERAMARARALGVLGTSVIFLSDWVPAAQRSEYLLDADIAVSAHKSSLETHYAFRTRVLDHFWAWLPSIVSSGDSFADYIQVEGLGEIVEPGDVDAFIRAVEALGDADERATVRARIDEVRGSWRWSMNVQDLTRAVTTDLATLPLIPPDFDRDPASDTAPAPRPSHVRSVLRRALGRTPLWPLLRRVRSAVLTTPSRRPRGRR